MRYEVWTIEPNMWHVDADGRATTPCCIRLISRHRLARTALAGLQVAQQRLGRAVAVIDEDGHRVREMALFYRSENE